MKKIDPNAFYHETNEWVRKDNDSYTIGITDFAQTVFGNVISVEFPEVGKIIKKNELLVTIESDKVSTEIFSPLNGKVVSINSDLGNTPEWLNTSPYEKGWLVKIELIDADEMNDLMSSVDYQDFMSVFYNKI